MRSNSTSTTKMPTPKYKLCAVCVLNAAGKGTPFSRNVTTSERSRSMMKSALERMLNTELEVHLGRRTIPALTAETATAGAGTGPSATAAAAGPRNRRNGHSQKSVQGDMGELTLATPRDRNGTFEPHLIAKHQRRLSGFDEKIMALYDSLTYMGQSQNIVWLGGTGVGKTSLATSFLIHAINQGYTIADGTCSSTNCSPSSTDPVPIIPKPNCLANISPTTVCSLMKSATSRSNRFRWAFSSR